MISGKTTTPPIRMAVSTQISRERKAAFKVNQTMAVKRCIGSTLHFRFVQISFENVRIAERVGGAERGHPGRSGLGTKRCATHERASHRSKPLRPGWPRSQSYSCRIT